MIPNFPRTQSWLACLTVCFSIEGCGLVTDPRIINDINLVNCHCKWFSTQCESMQTLDCDVEGASSLNGNPAAGGAEVPKMI